MKILKKWMLVFLLAVFSAGVVRAQTDGPYDENRDAHEQLNKAIQQAKAENKHVFLMIGGNW